MDQDRVPSELSGAQQRLVYLLQDQSGADHATRGTDLMVTLRLMWRQRWTVLFVASIVTGGAIAYALSAQKWYRSSVLLAPVESSALPVGLGSLANIASLAGLNLSAPSTAESLATLKSRDLKARFIQESNLLTVLFADKWDAEAKRWKTRENKSPDLRDAVKFFAERVMSVSEDRRTGLVTVSVEWKDPQLASDWASAVVARANEQLRARALREAQTNIDNLTRQLAENRVVGVQQSVGRVLESEVQKLMMASGADEFAFRTIDPATTPKLKVRPQRTLICAFALVLGTILGALVVVIRNALQLARENGNAAA
jgi:uncharacterized protein involved in exopolysaccharide biosynthesis